MPIFGGPPFAAENGTLTFYRGTTYYDALETVQNGTFDAARLAERQASASYAPGLYLTSQDSTAAYSADLAGLQGRGGGPATLQVTVPQSDFSALMQKYGIQYETGWDVSVQLMNIGSAKRSSVLNVPSADLIEVSSRCAKAVLDEFRNYLQSDSNSESAAKAREMISRINETLGNQQ